MAAWEVAFFAALRPILEVLIISMIGTLAATEWAGLSPSGFRDQLSKATVRIFIPSLLVYSLASYASFENIIVWFWVPAFVLLNKLTGLLLGYILCLLCGEAIVGAHQPIILVAASIGNHKVLPLIIGSAICKFGFEVNEHFDGMDSLQECKDVSLAIVTFSLWVGTVYNYIAAPLLLQKHGGKKDDDYEEIEDSVKDKSDANPLERGFAWLQTVEMPILASAVGLTIGLIPPLKASFHGEGALLGPLSSSLQMVGMASIPLQCLILGGNLLEGLQASSSEREPLHPVLIAGVTIIRLGLLPCLGIGAVWLLQLISVAPTEPLVLFLMLLVMATPSGIVISLLTNYYQAPGKDSVSVLLLVQHVVAIPTLTLFTSYFLLLSTASINSTQGIPDHNATTTR